MELTITASLKRQLASTKIILILTLLLICYGSLTDSLMCYQCSDSGPEMPCALDVAGMANSSTRYKYAKNCSEYVPKRNWTRCMIQFMGQNGKYAFYNRDCHDGVYFSSKLDSVRFHDLPAINKSTCDLNIDGNTICYQPCDTDFCNGPVPYKDIVINCTETDPEDCGVRAVFARKELLAISILCVFVSLFVSLHYF